MYSIKFKTVVCATLAIVSTGIALLLSGCEGGMVGTGTGPSNEVYELKNLPERISPEIPKTILKGDELNLPEPGNSNSTDMEGDSSSSTPDDTLNKAEGWEALNFELNFIAYMRLQAESNVTLLDLAFEEIQAECAQQTINCTIPAETLRVTLTQDVINRFIKLYSAWAESVSAYFDFADNGTTLVEQTHEIFNSLVGAEVIFGETQYSQLAGAPYDHIVHTYIERESAGSNDALTALWQDQEFVARWREDGTLAKFRTTTEEELTQEFFYQNGVPGELIVANFINGISDDLLGFYAKVIGNDPGNAGILIELVSASHAFGFTAGPTLEPVGPVPVEGTIPATDPATDPPPVLEPEPPTTVADDPTTQDPLLIGQVYDFFQGQMDNDGGYTSYEDRLVDVDNTDELLSFAKFRESFDRVGKLLAGERCFFDAEFAPVECNDSNFETYGPEGSSVIDSVHYFTPDEFDSLASTQDAIRWKVEGLPVDIKGMAVVRADQTTELSERELLCRGFQFVREDVRVFCSAVDEQLDNTVVVELAQGRPSRVIPEARLVQIQ